MLRKVFIIINAVALTLFGFAQDYPYPVSPGNTNVIDTDTPTLTWKTSANFTSYIVEIYSCNYDKGSSFDVLEVDNFIYESYTSGPLGYEASALTTNVRRPGNFTTLDDEGLKITSYRNNFNNTAEFTNFLAGEDYEGLTYLFNEYHVVVEEKEDVLSFLKFVYDSQGNITGVNELSSIFMDNPFISGQNNGWEGLSYNPRNDKLYLAKEYGPTMFCETSLPSGPNFTGSVNLTEPFDINNTNWLPTDISGLFHLSLDIKVSATTAGDHILILSQEDEMIFEVDMNGNLISQKEFNTSGYFGSITNGNFKPEGIAYQDGSIWIASDTDANNYPRYFKFTDPNYRSPTVNNPGLVHTQSNVTGGQYQVPAGILSDNSEYCWRVIGVMVSGLNIPSEHYNLTTNIMYGCTDNSACNYDSSATVDDGSCLYIEDCIGICGGSVAPGSPCNDNNPQTGNDKYNSNCVCEGVVDYGCMDANACNYDIDATADDGSCLYITDCEGSCGGTIMAGSPCNDGDSSTTNDVYDNSCDCVGLPIGAQTVCYNISNGNDDVEETSSSGSMDFTSNDMDLADSANKIIGLRFNGIDVPYGATILSAHIQFAADESYSQFTNLSITAEDSGNANAIIAALYNISYRNYITQNVQWNNVSPWLQGEKGAAQLSPDIAQLIQHIVNRTDWQAGNSMLFKINGTGRRSAASFESNYESPKICISYLEDNCPASLSLGGTINNDQIFSAEIEIESSANINNSIIDYLAGDTIKLMPGFNVDGNSDFTATIQICQ